MIKKDMSLESILKHHPDAMFIVSRSGACRTLNQGRRSFREPASVPPHEMKGEEWSENCLPPSINEDVLEVLSRGEIKKFEYDQKLNKSVIRLEARLIPCDVDEVLVIVRNYMEEYAGIKKIMRESDLNNTILLASPTLLVVIDAQGKIISMNESMLTLLGYERHEVEGRDYLENLVPKGDWEKLDAVFRTLVEKNEPTINENRIMAKNGREFLVEWHGRPIFKDNGEFDYFFGIGVEISDRRRAEETLQQNRDMLNGTLNSTADGILVVDEEGNVITSNRQFSDMWRIPLDVVAKGSDEELLRYVIDGLENPGQFLARVEELYRTSEESNEEIYLRDGRFFERYTCPLASRGKIIGRVWNFRDITGRKLFEKEIKAKNKELEILNRELLASRNELETANMMLAKSEQRLTNFLDNLPGLAFRCSGDNQWTMEYISNGCRCLTGYEPEDLIGNRLLSYNDIIHPNDRDYVRDNIMSAIDEGRQYEIQYRIIKKEGAMRWVFEKGKKVSGTNNDIYLEGFVNDITDMVQKDEQLRQVQKMETIGTLAGGLAHDFNNVLGGIIGSLALLENTCEKDVINREKTFSYIHTARVSADRAADMVKRLLAVSRKHTLEFTRMDINNSMENILKICKNSFPKSVKLEFFIPESPSVTAADSTQIEQVILNLCVNASHAMTVMREPDEEEGGTLRVRIEKVTADKVFATYHPEATEGVKYWVIDISDTGVGIDSATRQRIFEPFFSTKTKELGTGLGLSMVYSIIKEHNGFIDVYSERGRGSTFRVYLPIIDMEAGINEGIPASAFSKGRGIILVIDDEEVIRNIAKDMLEEMGYMVITAANGGEGILEYQRNSGKISVVIVDLSMPGMSGKEVYSRLRAINPEIKAILTSGFQQDDRVRETLDIGINGFLQKPFDLDSLAAKLGEILSEKG